ncbi:tetrapyrrole-binding protein, chloroplastic [Nymphaea colorata]|uniref:tetrapyrrole-binding protein, chloroplastic n=1 Tax=Nymphaea colorata TaxID=210225 RepID=UPI00129D647A|nr:tetrapyrrole-binding protein, chloroplastic [Nymphaea colorata]
MATSFSSIHHHIVRRHHFPPPDSLPSTTSTSSSFLKPTSSPSSTSSSLSLCHRFSIPRSSTATTATTTTSQSPSLDLLESYLSSQQFQLADEETRRLLIVLAGEAAQKRKYVFFSEVQFIPTSYLSAIDELWRKHSNGKFGYSVQRRILRKMRGDFSKFFVKVGWMKKLETEVEQYTYRSFPSEFLWELNDQTPEGHLPLTNALRGTQLLNSVLDHPAFQTQGEEEEVEDVGSGEALKSPSPVNRRSFTSDYSF